MAKRLTEGHPAQRLVLVSTAASFVRGTRQSDTGPCHTATIVIHGSKDGGLVPLDNVFDRALPLDLPVVVVPGADHFFHRRLHVIRDIITRMAALNVVTCAKTYQRPDRGRRSVVRRRTGYLLRPARPERRRQTTLRLCLGLTGPDSGIIELNGCAIPADGQQARARVGVVPQFDNLDPDFTCAENLLVFGRYFGLKDADIKSAFRNLLDFAGLANKADARIATLSGGMKRRLTLARALVNNRTSSSSTEPTRPRPAGPPPDLGRLKQLKAAGRAPRS